MRDDPVGAESRGIDVVRIKTIAFCVSCALCGLAGSLYGTFSQLVSPELGLLQQTGLVLSMVVIGGMSSLTGAHRRRASWSTSAPSGCAASATCRSSSSPCW